MSVGISGNLGLVKTQQAFDKDWVLGGETLGERLERLRNSLRLTQAEIAHEFDITEKQYGNWERDSSSPSGLDKMRTYQGVVARLVKKQMPLAPDRKRFSEALFSVRAVNRTAIKTDCQQAIQTALNSVRVPTKASQACGEDAISLCLSGLESPRDCCLAAYFVPFTWFAYRPWENVQGLNWISLAEAEERDEEQGNLYLSGFRHAERLITQKVLKSADWRLERAIEEQCAKFNCSVDLPQPVIRSLRRSIRLDEILTEVGELLPAPPNVFLRMGYMNGIVETVWAALRIPDRYHTSWSDDLTWFQNLQKQWSIP